MQSEGDEAEEFSELPIIIHGKDYVNEGCAMIILPQVYHLRHKLLNTQSFLVIYYLAEDFYRHFKIIADKIFCCDKV